MVGIIGVLGFAWFSRFDGKQFFFIGMEEFLLSREEILTQFGYGPGMVTYLLYRYRSTKADSGNGEPIIIFTHLYRLFAIKLTLVTLTPGRLFPSYQ